MSEKLEFDLSVKNNQLSKALEDGTKKASILEGSLSTAIGVFAGGLATKAFDGITAGFGKLIDFGKESIKNFEGQQDALNKLGQSLKASGSFSQAAVDDFSAFASQLQATSKFGDEVVISQIAVAKSLGATNARAKELVQAAANLSATFGGSLEENVLKLGKTLSGETGRLGQLIPELKGLTRAQLEAGDAADIINKKFAGASASELNTYSGSVIAVDNAFSDLQEEIGGVIVSTLGLQEKNNFLKGVYEELTVAVKDYAIAQSRGEEGFVETSDTIGQLKRDYDDLRLKIIEAEQVLIKADSKDTGFFESIFLNTARAKEQVQQFSIEAKRLEDQIKSAQTSLPSPEVSEEAAVDKRTSQEIAAQEKLNNEILSLQQQLIEQKRNNEIQADNLKIEDEAARNAAELERIAAFEISKAEQQAALKAANATATLEGEEERLALLQIQAEKELAIDKIKNDKLIKGQETLLKIRKDAENARAQYENKLRQDQLSEQNSFFNAAISLSNSKSKELAAIGKAAAIVNATIAGKESIVNSFNFGSRIGGPPLGFSFAGIAAAATSSQIAQIAGVQFENGGVVGGTNGASVGPDNRQATIRDGEMILNASQQKNLMDMLNSGGGSGDIVIQIDGRTIARAVRDQVKQGFVLV